MKFIFTAIMSVMLFGCASSGRVTAVEDRVSVLEGKNTSTQADINNLKEVDSKQDAELGDINSKLDRLLAKRK